MSKLKWFIIGAVMVTEAATGAKEMMSTAENGMKEIATEISSAFHE